MMRCGKFNRSLPDWIAGRLPANRSAEMAEHDGVCARCHDEAEAERSLVVAFRSLPAPSRSFDARPLLASRLAEQASRWVLLPRRWAFAGTLAAGVLCAVIWVRPFTMPGFTTNQRLAIGPGIPDEEGRIVTVVASMRAAADPDSEYTIDIAHHVPSQQRAVLVGGAEK